jgi:putative transposase
MVEAIQPVQAGEAALPHDPLTEALRQEARAWLETMLREELAAVLGSGRHERTVARQGYRHGTRPRTVTTGLGPVAVAVPRGRLQDGLSAWQEWQSQLLPRYARRARAVDAALVGLYCAGTNTRRLKRALQTLLGGGPVSRSAVSRVVAGLQAQYQAWRQRDLAALGVVYVYLDAMHVKVRVLKRMAPLPVQAAVGVLADGQKVLLDLAVYARESGAAWGDFLERLAARGLGPPRLVIGDGSKGLEAALRQVWPGVPVQRCVVHKLRNLAAYCPKRLYPAVRADYHRIVYAVNEAEARRAWLRFTAKWGRELPQVVSSLEEAGAALLTFFQFPPSQWKTLRTTNAIERVIEEGRHRIKTQGVLPSVGAVVTILYGLVATGQLVLRRIDGYQDLAKVLNRAVA